MEDFKTGKYQHYKGGLYEALGIATHSETMEKMVVYKALYQPEGQNLWIRPLDMFAGTVLIDGKEVPRFLFLEA